VVTKITNFGVFVELEPGLEGLLHVSEIADHKVEKPEAELKIGDEIEVKILRVDTQDRKIGLSKKRAEWASEGGEAPTEEGAAAQEKEQLKGGFGSASGSGIFGSLNQVQMPQKEENQ
jgi:small subunit ribosomal protein S1